jgi:hypothetical protein
MAETREALLLKPSEAARLLSMSERKLWDLSAPRGPIPCIRDGKLVRYDPADLQAWVVAAKTKAKKKG